MNRIPQSPHLSRALTAIAVVVALAALLPGVAAAKKKPSCADQVVADWYDDGRVGKIYPLQCYRDAIASLPTDVIDYSNAKEEISRALAFARQGKPDPGGKDPTPATTTPTGTGTTGTGKTGTGKTGTGKTGTGKTGTDTLGDTGLTGADETASQTGTSGPSSVPVPLIVLGGLAVVLLAAGSAGYLRRRAGGGDDEPTPPASA